MGAYLLWGDVVSKKLRFDVILSETHTVQSEITEHPVEEGADVADHVKQKLDTITLEVFVSNAPLDGLPKDESPFPIGAPLAEPLDVQQYSPPLAPTPGAVFGALESAIGGLLSGKKQWTVTALQFASGTNFASKTYSVLRQLKESAELVQCITPMWDYDNLIVTEVTMPRTPQTGDGASFTITLKQIRKVEAKLVGAPVPTEVRGLLSKKKGPKSPIPVQDDARKKSILEQIKQSFTGGKGFLSSMGVPGF